MEGICLYKKEIRFEVLVLFQMKMWAAELAAGEEEPESLHDAIVRLSSVCFHRYMQLSREAIYGDEGFEPSQEQINEPLVVKEMCDKYIDGEWILDVFLKNVVDNGYEDYLGKVVLHLTGAQIIKHGLFELLDRVESTWEDKDKFYD